MTDKKGDIEKIFVYLYIIMKGCKDHCFKSVIIPYTSDVSMTDAAFRSKASTGAQLSPTVGKT